jgi:hypothetical protein
MNKQNLLPFLLPLASFAEPDISSITPDLVVPPLESGCPTPGKRVKQTQPAWMNTAVYHILYLPKDWTREEGKAYPVIVEYAGNGPYKNQYGDISTGHPEGSKMGYGLSGGQGYIWLCLPYLSEDGQRHVTQWWGDKPTHNPANTLRYAKATVPWVCKEYGGNPDKVFLCGFSRGAIACNFIGLQDEGIAKLWCAFLPYSHYDGVRNWGYPGAIGQPAMERLLRLGKRPQFVTHEGNGIEATKKYLEGNGIQGNFTLRPTGFRNHNDAWLLRPTPLREEMRRWMKAIEGEK